MRSGIVHYYDRLSNKPKATIPDADLFATKEWTYDPASKSWYGNPARSTSVRDHLAGMQKVKRDQGDTSSSSRPLSYSDLEKIQKFYAGPNCKTALTRYQVEIAMYVI
jgi:hypothetical protein